MKLSLIVATFGRSTELRRLLESISCQTVQDLELIVVDQNVDDRVLRVLEEFRGRLDILRITSRPGATRARNAGLAVASGDVIGFPDDDCWYPPGLVLHVMQFLEQSPQWDGIIGHSIDENGRQTLPWHDHHGVLTFSKCWRRAVTYVYFLRRPTVKAVGGFDETLGPGAGTPWGAGDDNDFMLAALERGARVYFDPELEVHHPSLFPGFDEASLTKRASYARADGRVLRKHPMPLWWMLAFFGMPLLRLCLTLPGLDRARMRFHWLTFLGRVKGYFDMPPI